MIYITVPKIPQELIGTVLMALYILQFSPPRIYPNFYHNREYWRLHHRGRISGIYLFINLQSLQMYVGQSTNILQRLSNYLYIGNGTRAHTVTSRFETALAQDGSASFCVIILCYVPSIYLDYFEVFWISFLNTQNGYHYNLQPGGRPIAGVYKHSEAIKHFLSALATGLQSAASNLARSAAMLGKLNPFYGQSHTPATLLQLQAANSAGAVYVYSVLGFPIVSFPSAMTLAKLISSTHTGVTNAIMQEILFRGLCYISYTPFPDGCILPTQLEVAEFLNQLQEAPVQNKFVFVFNADGTYLRSYLGVMDCARSMKVSHNRVTDSMKNGTVYNGYVFSAHRISSGERP